MTKQFFRIKEVAEMIGVPQSTLRYWENAFTWIGPKRTSRGHRRYTVADLEDFERIRHLLYDRGMKIDAAKKILTGSKSGGVVCRNAADALSLVENAISKSEPSVSACLEAVADWLKQQTD